MGKEMIKITQVANQYVLNVNVGAITVFETVENHDDIMLVLKRKINFFDKQGNEFSKLFGVQTLMDKPMKEALEQMQELGIKVIEKRGKSNVQSIK
jgi:hypothetical protein